MEDVKLRSAIHGLLKALLDFSLGITAMIVSANALSYGFNNLLAERLHTGQVTAIYVFALVALHSLAFKSKFIKERTAGERMKASFCSLVVICVVFLATWLAI